MAVLQNTRLLLGVTGGVAAYKSVDLASKLTQLGAQVDVILTEKALEFVTPLTFSAVTQRPVWRDLWEPSGSAAATHIELGHAAQMIAVVPATAHTIAKLAYGLADDMLTTTALASTAPLLIAPAMESNMYAHPATVANLETLRRRGVFILEPENGRLASGKVGPGRLPETGVLLGAIRYILGLNGVFAGKKFIITAGGTQEPIDPVRFISNRSSGRQGFALAEAARDRGAAVTLITAPVELSTPYGVERVDVQTAAEMASAVLSAAHEADVIIMSAAVADFTPVAPADNKIKKTNRQNGDFVLQLRGTDDILSKLQDHAADFPQLKRIGFAAETADPLAYGIDKLKRKGLDLIVINDITLPGSGFGSPTNKVWIAKASGEVTEYERMPKEDVAALIMAEIEDILQHSPDEL